MRKLVRTLVVSLVVVLTTGSFGVAWAQTHAVPEALVKATPEQRAKVETEIMTERLSLTPEQIPQVEEINKKYAEDMQPILTGDGGDVVKNHRAARNIEGARDAAMQKVLSKDQFRKFVAARQGMRNAMIEKLTASLGLPTPTPAPTFPPDGAPTATPSGDAAKGDGAKGDAKDEGGNAAKSEDAAKGQGAEAPKSAGN
ncbi:MAG TPA: hypothetical protein VIS07_06225 [Candidatus Binatia bacterium]